MAGDGNLAYAVAPFLDPTEVAGDGNLAYAVAPFLDPTPLTQGMVSGLR